MDVHASVIGDSCKSSSLPQEWSGKKLELENVGSFVISKEPTLKISFHIPHHDTSSASFTPILAVGDPESPAANSKGCYTVSCLG